MNFFNEHTGYRPAGIDRVPVHPGQTSIRVTWSLKGYKKNKIYLKALCE
jgi:hypothetical protein